MEREEVKATMLSKALETGVAQAEYREGKALELFHPKDVIIVGVIGSPVAWLNARPTHASKENSHVIVNRDEKAIKLIIGEREHHITHIVGHLEESKIYTDLGINTGKSYTPIDLATKLKLLRSIFESHSKHAEIIHTLRNVKAKVNKGNRSRHFDQEVESNMPESFQISIELIKGEPKQTIDLDIILEADGQEIRCTLESVGAKELIDNLVDQRIDQEVEELQKWVTVIEQ
jgi:hypothetical protein